MIDVEVGSNDLRVSDSQMASQDVSDDEEEVHHGKIRNNSIVITTGSVLMIQYFFLNPTAFFVLAGIIWKKLVRNC